MRQLDQIELHGGRPSPTIGSRPINRSGLTMGSLNPAKINSKVDVHDFVKNNDGLKRRARYRR
jgi:hypothetical protein